MPVHLLDGHTVLAEYPDPQTGTYVENTLTCAEYASTGDQIRGSDQSRCEQAGLDDGASSATCACTTWTLSDDCQPCDVND